MDDLAFHPVAKLFPMMGEAELEALAQSIKANGQRHPILLYEGKILDGRNRYRACLRKGITPILKEWGGDDPWEFVWVENAERRHLPEGQKAVIWLLKQSKQAEWQEERRRRQEEANQARSEATKERPRDEDGTFIPSSAVSRDTALDNRSRNETAEKTGVSPATAARAEALVGRRAEAGGICAAVRDLELTGRERRSWRR